ncbi:hypothetical protein H663_018770 [Limnohabitans planktonicus II-D5]|uniref:Uncharacterized protein n=1 Tax=Limnohabitans planktonicus II-D5 TaxID=1293045 RepID=A0A2T7U8Z5_9BURK|nr:hypothetical protein H663_018770 [Limnohabitans planktonicus II-D5]
MARREEAAGCTPATTSNAASAPPGLCHRVRSGITHQVSVFVLTKFRIHQGFQRVKAVNCVF